MLRSLPEVTQLPASRFSFAQLRWLSLPPPPLQPATSAHLDMIRGLAACAVMCGHVRGLFFVDYSNLQAPTQMTKLLYAITGFGHESVMVFFVLSGFFISTAISKRYVKGDWAWRDYLIDRFVRLYIVLIPGLLLGALWDGSGSALSLSSGFYSHPLPAALGGQVVMDALTPRDFFGNLLFLQTIYCAPFGSNGPLWSLTNEFWYYILFPTLVLLLNRKFISRATLIYLPLAGFVSWLIGMTRLQGFLIWLFGVAVVLASSSLRFRRRSLRVAYALASAILFGVCLVLARIRKLDSLGGSDWWVGLSFALLLYGVVHLDFGVSAPYRQIAHGLAGFSYSLYVLHFPFLVFLIACFGSYAPWSPDFFHLALGASVGVLTMVYAGTVAAVTEGHSYKVRAWLRRSIVSFEGRLLSKTLT